MHKLIIEVILRNWISANTTFKTAILNVLSWLKGLFHRNVYFFLFFSPQNSCSCKLDVRNSCSLDLLAFQLVSSELLVHRGRNDGCWQEVGCQDPFLNAASQEGNIPSTAQHQHFFPISRPNATCPTLPPPSLRASSWAWRQRGCRAGITEVWKQGVWAVPHNRVRTQEPRG